MGYRRPRLNYLKTYPSPEWAAGFLRPVAVAPAARLWSCAAVAAALSPRRPPPSGEPVAIADWLSGR